jgi:hypothetical protein
LGDLFDFPGPFWQPMSHVYAGGASPQCGGGHRSTSMDPRGMRNARTSLTLMCGVVGTALVCAVAAAMPSVPSLTRDYLLRISITIIAMVLVFATAPSSKCLAFVFLIGALIANPFYDFIVINGRALFAGSAIEAVIILGVGWFVVSMIAVMDGA